MRYDDVCEVSWYFFEAVFVWVFENWFTYKSVRGCKYFCFEHVLVCVVSTNIVSKLVSLIK